MPIKKDDLEKLKSTLKGIDVDKLIAAATTTDEQPFEVPELIVLTATEAETRDTNMKVAGKKEGETVGEGKGKELAAKALKKKFGIEGDEKDLDKVVEAVNTKVATGDEGLKTQVQALLKDKETLTAQVAQEQGKSKAAMFDSTLIGMFPANRTTSFKDNELLNSIKGELTFEEVEGKTIVKRNGTIVTNPTTHAPLPVDEVIKGYFGERKWVTGEAGDGGRGGGDNPPGGGDAGIKNFTQAQTKWLADNPGGNVISPEFTKYVDDLSKADTSFDIYT